MKIQVWVLCLVLLVSGQEESEGERRLRKLRQKASKNIINFSPEDFKEYAMQYPRPYDLVIYFTASSCKLCDQLKPEYEYMAELYGRAGYTGNVKNPVFFVTMNFNRETSSIFEMFGFTSAPNLVVSKPEMAIISEMEKKQYLQKFKWAITYSDGDVTTHKMLDFANQRTGKDVPYKPTIKAMLTMFFGFIFVTAIAALIYLKLKFIWTHWLVWFVGVLAIYITCVSGVVYDIIHNVPFVGRDKDTGEVVVFTGGTREQYGAEGLVVSLTISFIGLLFVSIIVAVDKVQNQMQVRIWSLIALAIILYLVSSLESVYKSKSWYGPSIYPPGDYVTGPIARDQGNNI